jgi:hypothetical protein
MDRFSNFIFPSDASTYGENRRNRGLTRFPIRVQPSAFSSQQKLPRKSATKGQLKLPLENLLNVADGNSAEVCVALDAVATAFREAVRRGLDSDLT